MLPTFVTTRSAAADLCPTCIAPKSNPVTCIRASSGAGGVVLVDSGVIGVPPPSTITAPPGAVVTGFPPGFPAGARVLVVGHTREKHGLTVEGTVGGSVLGGQTKARH